MGAEPDSLAELKRQETRENVRRKRLENDEREGRLLDRADVLLAANELVLRLKSRFEALPEEFEQLVPREQRPLLKAEMQEFVRQRLMELAAWEPAPK